MTEKKEDISALQRLKRHRQTPIAEQPERSVRQPAQNLVVETITLSARIPHDRMLAYEGRVLEARRFIPKLTRQDALLALLELTQDEDIFERWLDKIEAR